MFFRDYTLRYAAVLFLLALFLMVTGLLVYALMFTQPQEPPRRSRPVVSSMMECHLIGSGQNIIWAK